MKCFGLKVAALGDVESGSDSPVENVIAGGVRWTAGLIDPAARSIDPELVCQSTVKPNGACSATGAAHQKAVKTTVFTLKYTRFSCGHPPHPAVIHTPHRQATAEI
jgi:hypothetical protein